MYGRNELCFCGSGKKYKKCCLGKETTVALPSRHNKIEIEKLISKKINEARIKQCLHPCQEECRGKIVKAHSIQNNRILKSLSQNGEIKMFKAQIGEGLNISAASIGRGVATTFTGFCSFHDKVTFESIEDKEYQGSVEQKFLFVYRAFAFEYHKKSEQVTVLKNCIKENQALLKNNMIRYLLKGNEMAIKDFQWYKEKFDYSIINKKYDILEHIELTLNGRVKISICSSFYLIYDLNGRLLNDINSLKSERLKMFFINVIPGMFNTHVILSWFKEDSVVYSDFKQQFQEMELKNQLKVLNNLIPLYSENFVMSPELWKLFSPIEKMELNSVFSKIYDVSPVDLNKDRRYNLFKGVVVVD